MKTLLATLAYVALSADGIIGVVARTRAVVGRFGQANLQVTKSSPPDSVELLLSTESCTVELSMTILRFKLPLGPPLFVGTPLIPLAVVQLNQFTYRLLPNIS